MGPTIIFDKSALQALSTDEAVWLDQFFNTNITPLFYVETLADLEKEVRKGRSPESVVGGLAGRTPDMSSRPNTHHRSLLEAELWGAVTLDLETGRPNLLDGRRFELDGKSGVIFQQTPEEESLSRWRRGDFLDIERQQAKRWRAGLANIDLEEIYRLYQSFFPLAKPTALDGVKALAAANLTAIDPSAALRFALSRLGVKDEYQRKVLDRWRDAGKPSFEAFAPYLCHVTLVDLFFHMALAADLIGRERPSNAVDLAYLYYLPFCMVFTSNDRLHSRVVPLFLRNNQTFVQGSDLKADLALLDQHFSALPEEVKARGVMQFASRPPRDTDFLVARLWDKHMSPRWRKDPDVPVDPSSAASKRLSEEIRQMVVAAKASGPGEETSGDGSDFLIVERRVRMHMGKWKRFSLGEADGSESQAP